MNKTVLIQIRENWPILALIVGLIIWYANVNSRLNSVEAQQVDQKNAIEQISDIKSDVSAIKVDISNIKDDLKFIKNKI